MPKGKYTRPVKPVLIPIGPSIAYVELSRGAFCLIDRDMASWAGQWNWYAQWSQLGKTFYAARNAPRVNGKQATVYMADAIIRPANGMQADHRNGLTLFNLRSNLREATISQNGINRRISSRNTSGYKGVSWSIRSSKWVAQIKGADGPIRLGYFVDPIEASRAYEKAAAIHHGEFRRLESL